MIDLHFRKKNRGLLQQNNQKSCGQFTFKDVRAQIFFVLWLQSDNELPMSEMQKSWGLTDFVFEIKHVENYPSFDKLALVSRHGLSAC